MKNLLLHTPEGVRDVYNGENQKKLKTLERVNKVIDSYGYSRISTPTFEFFDTFSKDVGTTPSNELFKFFDREGNTLVLRPDITPSIARAAAMYFDDSAPIRLSYQGNVFINYHSLQGRLKESTQIGGELIGDGSVLADAEIISVVVESLKATGLKDFQISLGHGLLINNLVAACKLSDDDNDDILKFIANKNMYGVLEILEDRKCDKNLITLFSKIFTMYCSPEDWADFASIYAEYTSVASIFEYFTKLYSALEAYGVSKYVSFELDMISPYKYYTGLIFSGYTYGSGAPIAKGGRYDKLLSYFGNDSKAIGFAIMADQLLFALERQNIEIIKPAITKVFVYEKSDATKAINEVINARENSKAVMIPAKHFDEAAINKFYGPCEIIKL